ncbi:MAG: sigma 54-interacting transcriptional regulator [Planctomycetales bacterium]|nr:sigma 54-interacting transcriptional regulator [Planctomycetales bacterium]
MPEILLLDADRDDRVFLATVLRESGYTVTAFEGPQDGLPLLRERPACVDLVVVDVDHDVESGLEAVKAVRAGAAEVPVVAMVAPGHADVARRAREAGAVDVLPRDRLLDPERRVTAERIQAILATLSEVKGLRAEVEGLRRRDALFREFVGRRYRIVGESSAWKRALEEARRLASVPRPVLIVGERGTGKEMIAATMHFGGPRAEGPFVTVNCAAFQGTLLEAELFGHEKGAFTGAEKRKAGRFELADGGTLFLDEIGNMSRDFQEKILRVVEYREFERLAGTESVRVDVRVIAGTNVDLTERVRKGDFRADLYDRLAFAVLRVPPLRERPEDIPALVAHFVSEICREVPWLRARTFSAEALARLQAHAWPGNVRELRNVVERLVCSDVGEEIAAADLPAELGSAAPEAPPGAAFPDRVASYEQGLLRDALRAARGSQKKAADALGLTYDQFRHLIRKYGIRADE